MADRSAPSGGYDFSEKCQYRAQVWKLAAQNCGRLKAQSQVLLMPSTEGWEIGVAKRKGFIENNIHVVDRNPAIVATVKRKYPRVKTYGVTVSRALERMEKDGASLRFANFDFCSNVTGMADELKAIGDAKCFTSPHYLVVNMQRGREQKWDMGNYCKDGRTLFGMTVSDQCRIDIAMALLHGYNPVRWAVHLAMKPRIYKSNRVTMLWLSVQRHDINIKCHVCDKIKERVDRTGGNNRGSSPAMDHVFRAELQAEKDAMDAESAP